MQQLYIIAILLSLYFLIFDLKGPPTEGTTSPSVPDPTSGQLDSKPTTTDRIFPIQTLILHLKLIQNTIHIKKRKKKDTQLATNKRNFSLKPYLFTKQNCYILIRL